jgi:hypothetical protein
MKKIFIGCGVIALLVLGILGFMVYQIGPVVMEAWDAAQVMGRQLEELEQEFPFDDESIVQLDKERFSSALNFRQDLAAKLDLLGVDLNEFGKIVESEDPSIFSWGDVLSDLWERVGPVMDSVPGMLRERRMSASELGWNSRVMWATLKLIDAGGADESMEPLLGQFDRFRRAYAELRRGDDNELPPLDDVIGEFDPEILLAAKSVFAEDPQRVLDGITDPVIEVTYLSTLTEPLDGDEGSGVRVRGNGEDAPSGQGEDPSANG